MILDGVFHFSNYARHGMGDEAYMKIKLDTERPMRSDGQEDRSANGNVMMCSFLRAGNIRGMMTDE